MATSQTHRVQELARFKKLRLLNYRTNPSHKLLSRTLTPRDSGSWPVQETRIASSGTCSVQEPGNALFLPVTHLRDRASRNMQLRKLRGLRYKFSLTRGFRICELRLSNPVDSGFPKPGGVIESALSSPEFPSAKVRERMQQPCGAVFTECVSVELSRGVRYPVLSRCEHIASLMGWALCSV